LGGCVDMIINGCPGRVANWSLSGPDVAGLWDMFGMQYVQLNTSSTVQRLYGAVHMLQERNVNMVKASDMVGFDPHGFSCLSFPSILVVASTSVHDFDVINLQYVQSMQGLLPTLDGATALDLGAH
jgi:hypothetical protein